MSRPPSVAIGDRFTRTGHPEKVYVVIGIREKPGLPAHADLAPEAGGEGPILIGLAALGDRSLYQRA